MFLQLEEVIRELKEIQTKLDLITNKVKAMYERIYGEDNVDLQ